MISRLIVGLGTFIIGYYVGREVGRAETLMGKSSRVEQRKGRVITVEPIRSEPQTEKTST